MIAKRQLDTYGGIGSILGAFVCVAIGWNDYAEGHAWHIWAVMALVLAANGIAMLRFAMHSPATPKKSKGTVETLRVRL